MINAIDQPQLGDIRKQFRLSDFSATRNDRIGEVLPHHRQEATDHAISLAVEDDRPPDMDHRIAATGQPIDVGSSWNSTVTAGSPASANRSGM